jgi:peptide-methionine (S)-S-oxide reductase
MANKIILGSGCFWCTEAIFQRVHGVMSVRSGYCGGSEVNPSYDLICTKLSDHAEVVEVSYDPVILPLNQLLKIFWMTHDPTTPNQQGADQGPQYRSILFPNNEEEEQVCHEVKQILQPQFASAIVTEIVPSQEKHPFWSAEEYHQDFYNNHPTQGYCQFVISPKVDKLSEILKKI